ncbi:SDR family NAD(P)-dependent oxidoreductase [Solidesulfovibrio sp. C21]|uniref:SDR family NAD(P)-dependent oxidoreductase n=1 Tax=Solidesulfovibrio sp. C21 TaxID=3398613 RepID=UPI0039FB9F79
MRQRALVTGASRGIGLEVAKRLLERDIEVVAVSRSFDTLNPALARRFSLFPFDLTDVEAIPDMVAHIGPVDILVNNAGMMLSLPFDAYPEEQKRRMLRLNLETPIALMREYGKRMAGKRGGRIVNTASVAAHTGHPDIWYGVTKAGLLNATKSFAKLLGPQGVIVNAVCPGPVATDMLERIPEARKAAIQGQSIAGRFAYPEEIAQTMVWLATESPAYINGTGIDIVNGI